MTENKKRKLRRMLTMLIFFCASYLALNSVEESWYFDLSGVLFLISGVYGIVQISRKKKYIY